MIQFQENIQRDGRTEELDPSVYRWWVQKVQD